MKPYRYFIGPDAAAFCRRVAEPLAAGGARTVAGQAPIGEAPGEYGLSVDLAGTEPECRAAS